MANYLDPPKKPFNAFLSGFSATVGQFVLTASLRIQTAEANKGDFPAVSPERYVYCYLYPVFFSFSEVKDEESHV